MPADDLRAARKLLSDEQLIAFFRAAAREADRPLAVRIINEHLDKGESLNNFFMMFGGPRGPRRPLVTLLKVRRLGPHSCIVRFGLAGGTSGDGGEWRVTYSDTGALLRVQGTSFWEH